ncbi:MAG: hypothetical protein KKB31_07955, partial [Nanoarchaeota archaeon]|nr:hypothetical protein [Nanoarchaeota archaeon]
MTDKKTIIINLSKNELLYIDDSITIEASEQSYSTDAAVATDEFYAVDTLRNLTAEAKIAVPLHLVLKLGGALLAIIESGSKPESIDVSLMHAEI